ncbi:hypothetical protein LEN26_009836 [Aphanomyces euteiches]|nr:hypothetical protein AeMF1_010458 [Aphanomyces euteiches]KAH9123757.1 hypothetical protein LEN26_009836 [Aphanomyces euteiches]KAH9194549.1 hypothetical protein AeNC1_003469 [Aphanomyces euteiches]
MTETRRSKRLAGTTPAADPVKEAPAKKAKKSPVKKAAKNEDKKDEEPATETNENVDANASAETKTDENAPVAEETAKEADEAAKPEDKAEEPAKAAASSTLKVGDTVPNVELHNEDDEVVHVHDLVKEKGAVFFMFPKADTPGCTKQACGFRDEYEKFTSAGYNVFALGGDTPKALQKWKAKKELPYKLLSDPKHALIGPFGSSKPGKKVQRSHVIVGAGGAVVEIQSHVGPQDSVDKSVAFVTKA